MPDSQTRDLNAVVGGLALAAQQAALLRGAVASGFLHHFGTPIGVTEVADLTGIDPDRARAGCVALHAAGVLDGDAAGRYRLSATFAPLPHDDLDAHIAVLLRNVEVRERLYGQMFTPEGPDRYADLPAPDRLAIAAGSSLVTPSALSQRQLTQMVAEIPLWAAALDADDARYLDLGCGVGGTVLELVRLYPRLTAVGVDLAADLLGRARADAAKLDLAARARFVVADATTFSDPGGFSMVTWSQFFFPAPTRAAALANAYRLLRPGGLLLVPVLPAPPAGPPNPQFAMRALLLAGWGVPVVTAEEVRAEVTAAGFEIPAGNPGDATTVIARRRA